MKKLTFTNAQGQRVSLRVRANLVTLTIAAQRAVGSQRFYVTDAS